jgi:adenylate cyclase class 2
MPTEIEAKFLDVSPNEVRERLTGVGAVCEHPTRLMRRDLFDHADGRYRKGEYAEKLRIRDEGNKLTMTYKKLSADSKYAAEIETVIGSYDATKQLLTAVGLHSFSYQESKRETWRLNDVEIVIDEWPWLRPYIEIEGPSEKSIQAAASKLGFNWSDARFGSVDTAYRSQYPKMTKEDSIGDVSEVRFDLPVPDFLKERM